MLNTIFIGQWWSPKTTGILLPLVANIHNQSTLRRPTKCFFRCYKQHGLNDGYSQIW